MTKPNWCKWVLMPEVKVWEACVLSIGLEPKTMEFERESWMYAEGTGPHITSESFPSRESEQKYKDLVDVLAANLLVREHFSPAATTTRGKGYCGVRLDEFVRWATLKVKWLDLPPELAGLILDKTNGDSTQTEAKAAPANATEQSVEEEIASWFDGVGYEQLATMFKEHPDPQKNEEIWKSYADEARNNKLKAARVSRAKFNPYRAGQWWLDRKNPTGWDKGRLHRTLANNLPARSLEHKPRLTGDDYK